MAEVTIQSKQYILPEGITIIGRGNEADIQIDSSKLSRLHARFSVQGDEVALEDLGSKNGTFVNDERLKTRRELDGSESVKIADIECALWGSTKEDPVPVKKEIKKKSPAPSMARKEPSPENNSNLIVQIVGGILILAVLGMLIVGLGDPEDASGGKSYNQNASSIIEYAKEAYNSVEVSARPSENDNSIKLLEGYMADLSNIPPSAGKDYQEAISLINNIRKKLENVRLKNDGLKRAVQGNLKFEQIKADYENKVLSPPVAIAQLEGLLDAYGRVETGGKARKLAGDIRSESKKEEKLTLASTMQKVRTLSNNRKYREALLLLDEAAEKDFYFVEQYDVNQIGVKRKELVSDVWKSYAKYAARVVRQAETGDCEKLKKELRAEFDRLGIAELEKSYTESIKKIDTIRNARLAKAREAMKKDLEILQQYEVERLYEKAAEKYTYLLTRISDEELKKEIRQKERKNSLFLFGKQGIINLVKEKGGLQVDGLGFVRKIGEDQVEVFQAEDAITFRWKRIEKECFFNMVREVMKLKENAEFYMLLGYHLLGENDSQGARLNFGKAKKLSPAIFKKYPDITAYMRSGVEDNTDLKEKVDNTTGIKENIDEPEPDVDLQGDLMSGDGEFIIVIRVELPGGEYEHKLMRVTKSRKPPRLIKLQEQIKTRNKFQLRQWNRKRSEFKAQHGMHKKYEEPKPEDTVVTMVGKAVKTEEETKDIIMADKIDMMGKGTSGKAARAKIMKEYLLDHFTLGTNGPIEWFNETREKNGCNWDFRAAYFPGGGQKGWDKVFLEPWNKWVNPDKKRGMQQRIWIKACVENGFIPWITMYNLGQSEPANYKPGAALAAQRNMKLVPTMTAYWDQVKLVMQICNEYAPHPFVIQIEPDEWGHMLLTTNENKTMYPLKVDVKVGATGMDEIKDLEDNLRGYTRAWLRLREMYAPNNVLLAANPSAWDEKGSMTPDKWNSYFKECEADKMDLAVFETGDRDRGCPGSQGGTPRENPPYGDKVGHMGDYEAQLKYIQRYHELTGMYVIFWQVAVGNTYFKSCNQTHLHYCDNIVQKVLGNYPQNNMISRYVKAGCIGYVFSSGQGFQTHVYDAAKDGITNPAAISGNEGHTSEYADDDGGYFRLMGSAYYKRPYGILNKKPKSGPGLKLGLNRPLFSDPYEELLYHRYTNDTELAWEVFRLWKLHTYAGLREYTASIFNPNRVFFGD